MTNLFRVLCFAGGRPPASLVWAANEAQEAVNGFSWGHAARFFGGFLLIMAMVYAALLFTGWVGKKRNKH